MPPSVLTLTFHTCVFSRRVLWRVSFRTGAALVSCNLNATYYAGDDLHITWLILPVDLLDPIRVRERTFIEPSV